MADPQDRQGAETPAAPNPAPGGGHGFPMSLAFAAVGLVAVVLSRFQRD